MACIAFGSLSFTGVCGQSLKKEPAIQRALGYLTNEVPKWSVENKCYSCHNNGDAARALYTAKRMGIPVAPKAIEDTTRWLSHPESWNDNGGKAEFNDKKLATIQFAFALVAAIESGEVEEGSSLLSAAEMVANHQENDGLWRTNTDGGIGSPVTYGDTLATAVGLKILTSVDGQQFKSQIDKANRWLRDKEPKNVLDATGMLIGLGSSQDHHAVTRRTQSLELINKSQGESGGWGLYVDSAPEAFDTAIVLLALKQSDEQTNHAGMIQRGRGFLIKLQSNDGSWPETTRPSHAKSYAHRLSTTGWATLALLETKYDD